MRKRWSTPAAAGVIVLMLIAIVGGLAYIVPLLQKHPATWGLDYKLYTGYAQSWVDGQGFYLAAQLAGPYAVGPLLPPLYPPTFLWLIVPFLVLPWVLWWAIPLGIIVWCLVYWRPGPWAWAAITACIAWPRTLEILVLGNPTMWIVAALAAGTIWAWPSVMVLAKPSLFPFALVGIRHRSWWVALAVFLVLSLALLPMWFDYITALRNADQGLLYSLRDVPTMLIPMLAYWGSRRRRDEQATKATTELIGA